MTTTSTSPIPPPKTRPSPHPRPPLPTPYPPAPAPTTPTTSGAVLGLHTGTSPPHHDYRLRVFLADEAPELAACFEAKHRAALGRYQITTGDRESTLEAPKNLGQEPGIWLFIAERSLPSENTRGSSTPIAGVRLDLRLPGRPLGVERALARFGAAATLQRQLSPRSGELAGWWVDAAARAQGLPRALFAAGIAFGRDLGLEQLVAFAPRHTVAAVQSFGFQPVSGIGELPYPDERYHSRAMLLSLLSRPPLPPGGQPSPGARDA